MRSEDIAWAAGLFEGEGCFFTHQRKGPKSQTLLGATLTSTDEDVVRRFVGIVGVGKVRGPIDPGSPKHKPSYHWRVQDAAGTLFVIELLSPWLGKRRSEKAQELIATAAEIGIAPRNRTHCPSGHEYTPANTMRVWTKRGSYRKCRHCWNAYKRRLAERKRLAHSVAQ